MESEVRRESLRERVLLGLAKREYRNTREAFGAVTEASAVALGVDRVSIWRLLPNNVAIVCEHLFLLGPHRHERPDRVLLASDYPRYFAALLGSRTIPADDACTDPRTREFAESYLRPLGVASMMDVPIWQNGTLYGVVCHEHVGPLRHWCRDEVEFAGNLADLVALALESEERRSVERRWTTVMEQVAEAVFVLDTEATILQMNRPARELFERTGGALRVEDRVRAVEYQDLLGRVIPRDELPTKRAARGQRSNSVISIWHEQRGSLGAYRVKVTPVYEGGQIQSMVAVLQDVTADIRLDKLKAEFLSAVAHELKTPVAVVKGYVELLQRDPEAPLPCQEKIATIERASLRTERLIDDAVEMSGLTLGRLSLTRERLELRSFLDRLVACIAATSSNHTIRLHASEAVELKIDRARIEQVLRRLVDNAVRYSPDGGDIDIEIAVEPSLVIVSVRDHGIGIPASHQPHIFEAFFRGDVRAQGGAAGLGIGLYLAREIVRLHGGDMWFESIEGVGSTFSLWLPREEAP